MWARRGVDVPLRLRLSSDGVLKREEDAVKGMPPSSEGKVYHCREVFWQPKYMVERLGDHASEKRSPESVSRCGVIWKRGVRLFVDQTCRTAVNQDITTMVAHDIP